MAEVAIGRGWQSLSECKEPQRRFDYYCDVVVFDSGQMFRYMGIDTDVTLTHPLVNDMAGVHKVILFGIMRADITFTTSTGKTFKRIYDEHSPDGRDVAT